MALPRRTSRGRRAPFDEEEGGDERERERLHVGQLRGRTDERRRGGGRQHTHPRRRDPRRRDPRRPGRKRGGKSCGRSIDRDCFLHEAPTGGDEEEEDGGWIERVGWLQGGGGEGKMIIKKTMDDDDDDEIEGTSETK